MIFYLKDWARFPNAIVHKTTKNKSFLRFAEKLRRRGVKNYYFFLALMQPELADVDPHDPDLDTETLIKIREECIWNPWYFFRECVRVPPKASAFPLPLEANRGNISLWFLALQSITVALIQPRQTGKSLSVDILTTLYLFVKSQNSRINLVTKDNDCRESNIERLKEIRMYLPPVLAYNHKGDSDNKHSIDCFRLKNQLTTAVGRASPASARQVGRGLTAPLAISDEGPFTPNIDVIIPSMLAAGGAARDEARANDAPWGTIFTTTAGKLDETAGAYMYGLINGGLPFTEELYDCEDVTELRLRVNTGSTNKLMKIVNCTFSHIQLGKDDQWMLSKLQESNAEGEDADRDFFNRWTSGNLRSALSTAYCTRIRSSVKEPVWTEYFKNGYSIRWHISKEDLQRRALDRKFIAGLDTSEAANKDGCSMTILDEKTMEVLGVSTVNETNLLHYALWCVEVMLTHLNLILVPERRSTAASLIDTIILHLVSNEQDPCKRIYNKIASEDRFDEPAFREVKQGMWSRDVHFYTRVKGLFGYTTSGSGTNSRNGLYIDALKRGAEMGSDRVYDEKLASELTGLVMKNGRIDHASAGNDDTVISWLLAIWFLTQSKNLDWYGIKAPLSEVSIWKEGQSTNTNVDDYEEFEKAQQRRIRDQIDAITEQLSSVKNEVEVHALELKLRGLHSRVKDTSGQYLTIDAIIKKARETRTQNMRKARDTGNRYVVPNYGRVQYGRVSGF